MDGGVAQTASVPTCNKRELAKILDVSLPTLDRMIDENPDFPVENRGSNGREYEFDPVKVKAWRDGKRAETIAAHTARMQALGSFDLGDGTGADAKQTPHELLAHARFEEKRRELQRDAGLLMDVASLRAMQAPVIQAVVTFLDNLPDMIGRKHALAPGMVEDIRADIEEARNDFVERMETALSEQQADANDAFALAS